ncbi:MAG: putative Na+/H+ antiporter [Leptospiraceae bacterium]|nr:putative Na+/H+ antiporter [Leptospiraceae bacterium]
MNFPTPTTNQTIATICFSLAVLHTFLVGRINKWAHHFRPGSLAENVIHFLAETEIVFGLWAAALFSAIIAVEGTFNGAIAYIDSLNFTEPKFVLVVMVMAASKPVVLLAEKLINVLTALLPFSEKHVFYVVALGVGPVLGSLITEPAAMTLLSLILKKRLFDENVSRRFAYASIGLLFVNISVGGVLTHFAAPPVLMVSGKWNWGLEYMFLHFGWRGLLTCISGALLFMVLFRKDIRQMGEFRRSHEKIPVWLTVAHLLLLALTVFFAHHDNIFFGVFMFFLGLTLATKEYQSPLKLREGLLVGFFLAGLVTLGSLQSYWLKPLLQTLEGAQLYFGATALTAVTDNAALTYLGTLVPDLSDQLKYALVAGAVSGGGLTVIANAPNPAGVGILSSSKVFSESGISPLGLFAGAAIPTALAVVFFWLIR